MYKNSTDFNLNCRANLLLATLLGEMGKDVFMLTDDLLGH